VKIRVSEHQALNNVTLYESQCIIAVWGCRKC